MGRFSQTLRSLVPSFAELKSDVIMQNKFLLLRIFTALSVILSLPVLGFPEQCIVQPSRTTPCEHLIYKRLVSSEDNEQKEVVCVCLQDFSDLIFPSSNPEIRQRQDNKFKTLSRQLNIDEETLRKLIQY